MAKIATNDCGPINQAADQIEKTADSVITPVIAKPQPVVKKVRDVLNATWDNLGVPIWQWIKGYAGQQWELIRSSPLLRGANMRREPLLNLRATGRSSVARVHRTGAFVGLV